MQESVKAMLSAATSKRASNPAAGISLTAKTEKIKRTLRPTGRYRRRRCWLGSKWVGFHAESEHARVCSICRGGAWRRAYHERYVPCRVQRQFGGGSALRGGVIVAKDEDGWMQEKNILCTICHVMYTAAVRIELSRVGGRVRV